jgi:hypothetical protein
LRRWTIIAIMATATLVATAPLASADPGERLRRTRAELREVRASNEFLEQANDRLADQRDVALDGRDRAEAGVRALEIESRNWRYAAYALALITAATWLIAVSRRRDTVRIKIPDTIEELERIDDPADR